MRRCPTCQTVYTDESLKFCLTDGSPLDVQTSEEATQSFNRPIQIPIAQPTVEASFSPIISPVEQQKSSGGGKGLIFGLIGGFVFLLLVGVLGVVGWIFLNSQKKEDVVSKVDNKNAVNIAKPSVSPTPTPDETSNLKQKIAELEKKVQQQKQSNRENVPLETGVNANNKPKIVTARVSSPGDGFLALRSEPSAEFGDRILKIPHGSSVKVLSCLKPEAGKKGRWCRVDYDGNLGWAFDGYLVY